MGTRDHYVAALKGAIFSSINKVNVVDVSHSVKPFDVSEAAFYLNSCFEEFPEGTIHIVGVDSEPMINFGGSEGSFPSILIFKGHYFLSNDNGFFGAFLMDRKADAIYRIDDVLSNLEYLKFPTKNIFIPAAEKIAKGIAISSFASEVNTYKKAFSLSAVIETNLIKGNIVHIDNYGNLITNVHRSLFERFGKDTPFTIYYRNKDYYIDEINPTYNAVPNGEKVAIFNNNGLLEIAINRGANLSSGGASQLFGVTKGDVIRIEFTPRGSKETLESLF